MQLFLSGGGSGKDSYELDKRFIGSLQSDKPVLYIPIAMDEQRHPYLECLEWILNNFSTHNFTNFIMWTEAELKDKSTTDFQMFSGIYIGGGNTFKLLKELKDLGVFEILKELSDQNIPIYGGSAGALLCAKSIITAAPLDKNEVGITDLSALNLIQNSHLWVHYEEGMNSMVEKYINDYELEKVIAIPENAGIYVNDNGIEAVGPGNITVFRNNTKTLYKSGDATIIL